MKKLTVLLLVVLIGILSFSVGCAPKEEAETPEFKLAALFPGSTQDADYNAIGYVALQETGNKYDIKIAYSEKVAVPDAERVMKEYVNEGYNIIWVHGAQFNGAALKIGDDYPDVTFIIEVDDEPAEKKANFWYMDRNFYTGFYILGSLAGLKTETGNIGYLGGLELPFTRGEINAARQGIRDVGSDATLEYLYVGDFNDPLKTRQAAEGFISKDVDVIISGVNLGNYGLYNAVKEADKLVYITTKYTDKKVQAPDNYLTSDLFDFTVPIEGIVGKILDGEKGGFINLDYGKGKARYAQFPISNVSEEIQARIQQIADDVEAGKIDIVKNLAEVLP
ncbi:MAG: BMP family protein [Caldisericota bacterium]|nr:BMP family protein [Caldisericota bacterium]